MRRFAFDRATLSRAGAGGILLLLAVGSFEPFYFRTFTLDRDRLHRHLVEVPYRRAPELRGLLLAALERSAPGETVVLVSPFDAYEGGYRYAFGRASYVLAGRRVLAAIGRDDAPLADNVASADLVVAWRTPPPEGCRPIWTGPGGSVSRRAP